ncbi:hypothetical protein [Streptomyces mordarskii]|uniref:Caspase domain-containing protein n=1 Tax=Streptomyces mordarskii TaxID=1226758 RepID=A0ABN1DIT4_9ACTN
MTWLPRADNAGNTAVHPTRTHAIVVAVERYEDPKWNVSGPYSDARAFISWLVNACQVPEKNITLLSSALSHDRADDGRAALPGGIDLLPADSTTVSRLLQEELTTLEADLLWVFWSGHGLIDTNGEHVLLLADSTPLTKRGVGVDSLQRALQSKRVGSHQGAGVAKVAVAINACQNQPWIDHIAKTELLVSHTYVTDRGLFVLHACSTGQKARVAPRDMQRDGTAASLFPRMLLRYLDDGSADVLPDLLQVSESVDAEFVRLRQAGLTSQTPSTLRRNWSGKTAVTGTFAHPPTEREQRLADLLCDVLPNARIRDACAQRLTAGVTAVVRVSDDSETPTVEQLVTAAARVHHGVPTLLDLLPSLPEVCFDAEHLSELRAAAEDLRPDEFLTGGEHVELVVLLASLDIEDLRILAGYDRRLRPHLPSMPTDAAHLVRAFEAAGYRTDAASMPILLRFVALVAAEAGSPTSTTANGLRAWCDRVAGRLRLAPQTVSAHWSEAVLDAARRRCETAWILIEVTIDDPEADPGKAAYACSAWLLDPATGPQRLDYPSGYFTWRQTHQLVAELLEPYIAVRSVDLAVEFFLPESHLELQVERIPLRHRGADNVHLGTIVPVVVRCAHRHAGRRIPQQWTARWQECGKVSTVSDEQHWLVHDAADLFSLRDALVDRPDVGCVELIGGHLEFTPALVCCVQSGVPVLTWHRRLDDRRPGGDLSHLRRSVPPSRLPEEVRQLRADTSTWSEAHHLVLLWDDPQRLPPRLRLRTPGRIASHDRHR